MTLDELKTKVTEYFTGKPVKQVFVFGSFLEKGDEANDIDLIAEFDYEEAPSLIYSTISVMLLIWKINLVKK